MYSTSSEGQPTRHRLMSCSHRTWDLLGRNTLITIAPFTPSDAVRDTASKYSNQKTLSLMGSFISLNRYLPPAYEGRRKGNVFIGVSVHRGVIPWPGIGCPAPHGWDRYVTTHYAVCLLSPRSRTIFFLPPAYVVRREGNSFTPVCQSTHRGGTSVLAGEGVPYLSQGVPHLSRKGGTPVMVGGTPVMARGYPRYPHPQIFFKIFFEIFFGGI